MGEQIQVTNHSTMKLFALRTFGTMGAKLMLIRTYICFMLKAASLIVVIVQDLPQIVDSVS